MKKNLQIRNSWKHVKNNLKKQNIKLQGYGIKLKRLKDHTATPAEFGSITVKAIYSKNSDRILIGQETKWHWNSCRIQFRPEKQKNSRDKMG